MRGNSTHWVSPWKWFIPGSGGIVQVFGNFSKLARIPEHLRLPVNIYLNAYHLRRETLVYPFIDQSWIWLVYYFVYNFVLVCVLLWNFWGKWSKRVKIPGESFLLLFKLNGFYEISSEWRITGCFSVFKWWDWLKAIEKGSPSSHFRGKLRTAVGASFCQLQIIISISGEEHEHELPFPYTAFCQQ